MYEHQTTFAGRPVVDFGENGPADQPTDAMVAWRVSTWDGGDAKDEVSPAFRAEFEQFLDTVPPASVEALVIGSWGFAAFNFAPIELLCAAAGKLTGLKALYLGDITSEESEISWIKQGDVGALLGAYPGLEVLRVRGTDGLVLEPLAHPSLRHLAFETGGLPSYVVQAIGESDLPALEHLELWLGVENYGGTVTVEELAPVLSGSRWPSLRYLGLRNAEIADPVAATLASAPVVARLDTLDLSLGMLSDAGAEALLAGQPLTHLRKLDLHHHFLTRAMQDRLTGELPGIVDVSDWQDDARWGRYTAVSE